ncbi:hypothetical protein NE614_12720 [[Ruminococcus] torques]|uniref:hypothetical protein n=1 Tax=[Ruminococcus] torques TaxID=33039 RepID=UPI00210CBC44|nr:hypothetical protein [[Ruminococcus] torques]MCQ5348697.1 hypothetical protein [[Ruminococcus] torques]MCQ5355661.1 hypothetical protein [[Ruminococcus] torques]
MITAITAFNIMLATVTVTSPLAALSLSFSFALDLSFLPLVIRFRKISPLDRDQ